MSFVAMIKVIWVPSTANSVLKRFAMLIFILDIRLENRLSI